jgi:multidrug resistance efflux pump
MPHGEGRLKKAIELVIKHPLMADAVVVFMILALAGGVLYWQDLQNKIYIDKAEISAPVIALGPSAPGIIDKFYVQEGDMVAHDQKLAVVGNETIYSKTSGTVIAIRNVPGQLVYPPDYVIKMIDDAQLRLVGRVQEDKGLADIRPGQRVMFTVDAFGSKEYQGTVESVGASARQSDIVFSISDKREEREFEIKVLFDSKAYSELKNGMSAKMWIYKS